MIDTIVLRIHDLKKHRELVKYINMNFNGSSKQTVVVPMNEVNELRNMPGIDDTFIVDYFRNNKTGTNSIRYQSQQRLNSSGHYFLNIFEHRDRDFLELNFSIPKYIWGTNVLMFGKHMWDKDFKFFKHSDLKYNLDQTYDLLMSFIDSFFRKEFTDAFKIDLGCVEINRIDISYNQVFEDKKQALEFLGYQKKIKRKNSRDNIRNFREYASSLMYITERYSLKVYHKGSEYIKHDKKEHIKINKLKNYEYFRIKEIQSFADRILRYEITIRDAQLTYLFNHNVFRRNCPLHKSNYKIYKNVENANAKNDRISEKTGLIQDPVKKSRYIEKHPYVKTDPLETRVHEEMKKLLLRKRKFMLKTNEEITEFNKVTTTSKYFEERALFSQALFKECTSFFLDFVNEFQVKERPSLSTVSYRIDDYNNTNYKQLPKAEMLKFYEILQNNSFEEISRKNLYSKATYYRYLDRFNKIGVTKNNVINLDLINVPVDLRAYHNTVFSKSQIFNHQRSLCDLSSVH